MRPPLFHLYVFVHIFCPYIHTLKFPPSFSSSQSNMNSFKLGFLCFLLLFLGFNFSATESRSFRSTKNEVVFQEMHFQDDMNTRSYEELDELTTRRMDLENMDYGGTGANDRHDPKSPGRA